MYMNDYQDDAETTMLPTANNIEYLSLNLAAEAGEVAGKIAKLYRKRPYVDSDISLDHDAVHAIIEELGDVLWQTAMLANLLGYRLSDVAKINLAKLGERRKRGVIDGEGDSR